MELAVSHLAARGIGLELLPAEDNHGDANESAEAVRRLVSLRGAQAIIGPITSTNARSAAKVADELKIPMISPAATDAALTRDSQYAFRACYVDSFQGKILAAFAHTDLKANRAVILVDPSDAYSSGLARAFRESFGSAGGESSDLKISLSEREFGPQIQRLKQHSNADLVFMPADYPAVAAFLRQARQSRITQTFLTADGAHSPELFKLAGDAADGIYLTSHFAPDSSSPPVRRFVDDFTRKYSEQPNVAAALAYDATLMVGQAFGDIKPDESLRESLTRIRGLAGVTGTISLDSTRNPVKSVIILETAKQRFVYVRTVSP
jgi:branched-chain amino acid transport system substrate-binding protein